MCYFLIVGYSVVCTALRGQKLRKMVSNIRGGEIIFFALLSGTFQVKDSDKGGGPMAIDFG